MADAILSVLLENVKRQLLLDDDMVFTGLQNLITNLEEAKEYLGDEASTLQAEQLREMDLERQLKEVVYDITDAIESSSSQLVAVMASYKLFRPRLMQPLGQALRKAIESIRSRSLDPITSRIKAHRELGIKQIHSTETDQVPSVEQLNNNVQPPLPPKKFVGLEDEAETLIISLLKETEGVDVIAITGMPGIGKTTLASKIYHENRILEAFPTLIWIDNGVVSFSPCKELWLHILKQCKNTDTSQASCSNDSSMWIPNEDKLMDAVKDTLMKSKYLLIVDGVWDDKICNSVIDMLPAMGKVLITSRDNRVTTNPHVLRFLTEKESWELLQLEVFGEHGKCPETLKSFGERIARDCNGLPVAIAAARKSLVVSSSTEPAKNLTEKWWEAVSKNVMMYVTDYGSQHRVVERVELSYARLPQRLQECFLYLGVFPEGHEIPVRTLLRLWMAEGLLHDQGLILGKCAVHKLDEINMGKILQSLEETADKYLRELVDMNLVMVVKRYHDGQIKTCRLHKLIHAFCKYKATEKDLYQEIEDRPVSLKPNSRLCIYSDLSKFLSSKPKERSVRSILCFNEDESVVLSRKEISRIHKWFKLLRVLECRNVKFTRFPNKLNRLIHLRYISLSCDEISEIPENIAMLCYLETLVVDTRASSLLFKANTWRMLKLQHLVTKAAIVLAVPREGEVSKYLRTLTRLAPSCCTKEVFRVAPNLKTLGIRGHLATLAEPRSMIKLDHLENLKLINESTVDCQLHLDCIPRTLGSLTLSGTHLKWECMSKLGMIYCLKTLKLKNNAFTGESLTSTRADGFGRLRFLLIDTMDLVSWEASPDCFPSLKHLVLKNCENLQKVPSSLEKCLDISDVGNVPDAGLSSPSVLALSPTTTTTTESS